MRSSFFSIIAVTTLLFSASAVAQTGDVDIVKLKNGKIFIGKILEKIEGKTLILETAEGTEILDEKEIKEITKDFYPAIESVAPSTIASGNTVTLYGAFPPKKRSSDKIFIGSALAEVRRWSSTEVTVQVPAGVQGQVNVMLQSGSRSVTAPMPLSVTSTPTDKRGENTNEITEESSEKDKPSGFYMNFGYISAVNEMASNTGPTSGYGGGGFIDGIDTRGELNSFLFIPFHWQLAFLIVDESKLGETKAQEDMYFLSWIGTGFGVSIPLGGETSIGASYDVSALWINRPGFENDELGFSTETSSAFTTGTGYHIFLNIERSVTFGMKFITAKPKFAFDSGVTINGVSDIKELEIPVDLRFFYVAFELD